MSTLLVILIPFLGTTAGAACVFLMRGEIGEGLGKTLLGFASGVMVAASVWSLLLPSLESLSDMGRFSCLPVAAGAAFGMAFLLALDHLVPHLHMGAERPEGPHKGTARLGRTTMLFLAVTLHNIPEGMAPGVVLAAVLIGAPGATMAGALALSAGMAIQNFPEGAIISMPLAGKGHGKPRAFLLGTLSGAVEPAAAVLAVLLASAMSSFLPYLLSFAAGAMIYVVVEELIPEASKDPHSNHCTVGFGVGFILMMALDVVFG